MFARDSSLAGALLLTACAPSIPARPAPRPSAACPIISSADWAAWVNAMPGPGSSPKLIVIGKVTVPTGSYSIAWFTPDVAESDPVQVTVRLNPLPPSGPATQAVTTMDVRGEWPSQPTVGLVRINCGGK